MAANSGTAYYKVLNVYNEAFKYNSCVWCMWKIVNYPCSRLRKLAMLYIGGRLTMRLQVQGYPN